MPKNKKSAVLMSLFVSAPMLPNIAVYADEPTEDVPVIVVDQDYGNMESQIKKQLGNSNMEIEGLDKQKTGFQVVQVSLNDETTLKQEKTNIIVQVQKDDKPQLSLISDTVTVDNGAKWDPMRFISYINDNSGVLPVLSTSGSPDMNRDGTYLIEYTATNVNGISVTKELTVIVKTPEWVIKAREEAERKAREEAERKAREEAERKAKEEAERKAKEEAARQAALRQQQAQQQWNASSHAVGPSSYDPDYSSNTTPSPVPSESPITAPISGGGNNPYSGGWGNCTWGAWQAAYNYTGVSLPGFGNAYNWVNAAQAYGYATGMTPRAGSVIVLTNHVAYVSAVSEDGQYVYIIEGNYMGRYNERWISAYNGSPSGQKLRGYIYLKN